MIYAVGINILAQDIVHPCTRTFAGAREIVGIKDTYQRAIRFRHLEYLNFGIINRHVVHLLKIDAVELVSQVKRTLTNIVQFEIRFQFLFVQVVFLGTQFFCVEPPIPWLQFLTGQVNV